MTLLFHAIIYQGPEVCAKETAVFILIMLCKRVVQLACSRTGICREEIPVLWWQCRSTLGSQ